MANLVEDPVGLLEDEVVGKAQHGDALTSELGITSVITKSPAVVRGAVGFDGEARGCAVEVGEEAADGVLSSKLLAEQLPVAQQGPERGFGRRLRAPKLARPDGLLHAL